MPQARRGQQAPRSADTAQRRLDLHETPPEPLGKLVRYSVEGLFGQYDQTIELAKDGPTILTGANGSGKTTILKTINAVGAGEWTELVQLPFRSLSLKFERGPQIKVKRTEGGLDISRGKQKWSIGNTDDWTGMWSFEESAALASGRLALPPGQRLMSASERRRRMHMKRALQDRIEQTVREAPDWIRDIGQRFPVRFITDQRLVIHGPETRAAPPGEAQEDVRKAVSEYGRELGRRMSMWLEQYARSSQQEDRRFPVEVIEAMSAGHDVDEAELQGLIDEVVSKRADLETVGLVEPGDAGAPTFEAASLDQQDVRIVIKTFAEVTLRKFATIEESRHRLQLLVDFLNEHFVGKVAVTEPAEEGLYFRLPDGQRLLPGDLSSGEQQMLVLAYQLLFQTRKGTLLLIDEPEISLHVVWQNRFIDDIVEMGRTNDIQFLLATHSPTLIGGREELKRPLTVGIRR